MSESWGVCRLGDAVQRETDRVGMDPTPEVLSSTKHQGLVPSRVYFKGRQIFSDDLSGYRIVKPGWFAYATNHLAEGSIGLNNLGETGCVSPMYTVFSARRHVDREYLYHLLKSPELLNQYQLHEQASVDRRGSIRFSSFAEISVILPPLDEQRRIAEILDTIDETIHATERVIAKLRLAQLGLIDRSFDRSLGTFTELGAVCLAPGEYGCVATAEQRRTGWPRYVRITDLTDSGTLRSDSEMGVSPSVARKAILHPGDIVFARSGATVGKTYLYDPVDGLCAFAGYLIRFRPDPTKALPEFVRWWTHSSSYRRWVKRTMREGAQPNINAREYAKAVLPLPSIEEQNLIVASIVAVDTEIKAERRCRQKLRQLRSGLAADLLSGRVQTVAA